MNIAFPLRQSICAVVDTNDQMIAGPSVRANLDERVIIAKAIASVLNAHQSEFEHALADLLAEADGE